MKISRPILIILAMGIISGYFFTIGAYPIGLLCVPVCMIFFRFGKEKLSSHINIFSLAVTLICLVIYHKCWLDNIREFILFFFATLIFNIIGKIIKKPFPVIMQILSLIFWGLVIISFLIFSVSPITINAVSAKTIKYLSLLFSGILGIPPAPVFTPTAYICHENMGLYCSILMASGLPAVIINLIKDFKTKYIDIKFSLFFSLSLIIGIILGTVLGTNQRNETGEIVFVLSIIIPSVILFAINIFNTSKSLKLMKIKHKENQK
ncbi:MAG: hypothetical protein KBT47_08805 [Armatimonadetes bacterium]|nr:hypothetical protein [Candidatus Hippobium faecium]